MKKCLSLMFILLILCGCTGTNINLQSAKEKGYVVFEDGSVTSGEGAWQSFVGETEKKTPCTLYIAKYYTLGDPSGYSEEYYESIKDDYPKLFISEVEYDGDIFTVSYTEDDTLYRSEYKYLMRYEDELKSGTKIVKYVLVNDNTVTWNDIFRGMVSSKFGDYNPFYEVYNEDNGGKN